MHLLIVTTTLSFLYAFIPILVSKVLELINRPTVKELELHRELVKLKRELATIPMVDNFAVHARTQRKFNAVESELKLHSSQRTTNNVKYKFIVPNIFRVVLSAIILYVVVFYRQEPVLILDQFQFTPFTSIISYPNTQPGAISLHSWLMISNVVIKNVFRL